MTTQKNSSLKAAAVLLGVNEDALHTFVNCYNPSVGSKAEKPEDIFNVGSEMAVALDAMNPTLAQRWRMANSLTRLSQNDTAARMS
jgi:hypothetical protein